MPPTIITVRQSWWEKLKAGVKSSTPQVKQALIGAAVAVLLALGSGIAGYWSVFKENFRLKQEISTKTERIQAQDAELAKLRHENQNLISENNRLRTVLDPVERKAKELYPDLEVTAAISKLAKDLEDVRN